MIYDLANQEQYDKSMKAIGDDYPEIKDGIEFAIQTSLEEEDTEAEFYITDSFDDINEALKERGFEVEETFPDPTNPYDYLAEHEEYSELFDNGSSSHTFICGSSALLIFKVPESVLR